LIRNLCFTERSLQFSKFTCKSLGKSTPLSSLFALSFLWHFSPSLLSFSLPVAPFSFLLAAAGGRSGSSGASGLRRCRSTRSRDGRAEASGRARAALAPEQGVAKGDPERELAARGAQRRGRAARAGCKSRRCNRRKHGSGGPSERKRRHDAVLVVHAGAQKLEQARDRQMRASAAGARVSSAR
jgi:hypothetical protein